MADNNMQTPNIRIESVENRRKMCLLHHPYSSPYKIEPSHIYRLVSPVPVGITNACVKVFRLVRETTALRNIPEAIGIAIVDPTICRISKHGHDMR